MASVETLARVHDRQARRRPFSTWMKRLANFKTLHSDPSPSSSSRPLATSATKVRKNNESKIHPYTLPRPGANHNVQPSLATISRESRSVGSLSHSKNSMSVSNDGQVQPKSRAPTLATTAETTVSGTGTGTTATTTARTEGDRDSTFSSPAPSLRSITTTLTTMQSTAPGVNQVNQQVTTAPVASTYTTQPATAIPAHLAPTGQHATYHTATANNLLSDNASVLTLASSSKRGRRRNSVDTNASMKALAPASMFGGSRESLPLSVLSGTVINPGGFADNSSLRDTASYYHPRAGSAMNAERASLISASGVTAPALASERNSYISTTKHAGDAGSIRSGLRGHMGGDRERDGAGSRAERIPLHGRNDSLGAMSIGASSLLREREREMVTAPTTPIPV